MQMTEVLVGITKGWSELVQELESKLSATKAVLGFREKELLALKGPCSSKTCRLHYAHSGPCDTHK